MNIIDVIKNENISKLKELLINEPNLIDGYDEEGIWLPFLAAKIGNLEIIKYIIEYTKASMDKVDAKNRTILHYAVKTDNVELIKYLVEKVGMSIFHGDINLITPYEEAHLIGSQNIERYFETITGSKLDNMYKNPIRTGTYPDPSIVRVNEDYYMVNSSFIYFPCIPISHSKDLINWHIIGHAITNIDYAHLDNLYGGRGYWAPDISYYNEKFYITATYRLNDDGNIYRKQMVTSSEKPEGPYCKPVFIEEDGIDPSIFNDDDGKRYMILNRGARIFEISEDGKEKISEAELLWYGDNKHAPEGSHLIKKDSYYYLFVAEGGTGIGHRISVARSKNLKGPYESCPYNPIMRQKDENAFLQKAGHGKPVKTQNDQWFMVYLCGRMINGKYSILGRETALDPVTWTADNWPIVNNLQGPSVLQTKPNLEEKKWEESNYIMDDFNESVLNKQWMFARPPRNDSYFLKNSSVYLKADSFDLNNIKCRSFLVRRQTDFKFVSECRVDISNVKENGDLGITCYYDENTYLKFGVYLENNNYFIKVSEYIDDRYLERNIIELPKTKLIELKIETSYLERRFYYKLESNQWIQAENLKYVYYLCDEGLKKGKRFTGAMIGIYVNSKNNNFIGKFDYFKIYS